MPRAKGTTKDKELQARINKADQKEKPKPKKKKSPTYTAKAKTKK